MDIGIILFVVLILALMWRGPRTLPRIGEAFGSAVRGARRAAEDHETDETGPPGEDHERDHLGR